MLNILVHLHLAYAPVVRTQYGNLHGTMLGGGVTQWMGIPYGEQQRFADPTLWTARYAGGDRDALVAGPQCPQPSSSSLSVALPRHPTAPSSSASSEDCLYLNVWKPHATTGAALPVMVWVHGGSFLTGNGDQYNASTIVQKHGCIVVTINYRLGHLGWLQVLEGQGNFGLKDQQTAFRWVSENIAAFGGDPGKVTVFGESAGAISIQVHLVAVGSKGLFQRALSESGFPTAIPQKIALSIAGKYAALAGCAERAGPLPVPVPVPVPSASTLLDCLRSRSLQNLTGAANLAVPTTVDPFTHHAWSPTVDAVEILADPLELVQQRRFTNPGVGLLLGTNTNEGSVFVFPFHVLKMGAAAYTQFIQDGLSNNGNNVTLEGLNEAFAEYPPSTAAGSDNRHLAANLLGDLSFICGSRFLARAMSSLPGAAPVFLYRFNRKAAADQTPAVYGVSHGSEVPFVFDHGDWIWTDSQFTPAEQGLATAMGAGWAKFAATGSPASPTTAWPQYSNTTDLDLLLDVEPLPLQSEKHPRAAECNFWAEWRRRNPSTHY